LNLELIAVTPAKTKTSATAVANTAARTPAVAKTPTPSAAMAKAAAEPQPVGGRPADPSTDLRLIFHQLSPETLISPRELATVIGMSYAGIKDLRKRGKGPPAIRFDRALCYEVGAVRAWLASRREVT
jgi:hypothetical protein